MVLPPRLHRRETLLRENLSAELYVSTLRVETFSSLEPNFSDVMVVAGFFFSPAGGERVLQRR